jgi:hypothetical protein
MISNQQLLHFLHIQTSTAVIGVCAARIGTYSSCPANSLDLIKDNKYQLLFKRETQEIFL